MTSIHIHSLKIIIGRIDGLTNRTREFINL